MSWGKIDPDNLPDCVVCYVDSTISLPLITAYALSKLAPRPRKRLYDRRDAMLARLREQYLRKGHGGENRAPHRFEKDEAAHGPDGGHGEKAQKP